MISLAKLLSPQTEIVYRRRRRLFEKRIVCHDGGNYVLYRFPLPWQARRLSKLLLGCEAAGVPTQKLLHCDKRPLSFLTHLGFWIVASYEQGQPWDVTCVSADQMSSLAQALARLHSVESPSPGPIFRKVTFRTDFPARELHSECLAAVNAAERLNEGQKYQMKAWLRRSSSLFAGSSTYQLVHGDLWAKNLLVVNGTFVRLIDYEKASFSYAGFELADALIRFTNGRNQKHRDAFLRSYFAECLPRVKESWCRHAPEFLVYAMLRLAWSRLRRSRMLRRRGNFDEIDKMMRQFDRYTLNASAFLQACNSGAGERGKLLALYLPSTPLRSGSADPG